MATDPQLSGAGEGVPFETVLVANRGEIAVRVVRTCKAQGYRTVAVYSDADVDAPHVALADLAVHIGPTAVAESYLNPACILAAAARAGADAVHPGYGFLSENADFAEQVEGAGLVWIGPPPAAMRAMADKTSAKRRMRAAGVPCVPGDDGVDSSGLHLDDDALARAARVVRLPLLVKASAGGGGRGMRAVHGWDDLADAIASARAEAVAAFGSPVLLLERLVTDARHVEVQVMADQHGNVLHLGERDCSVQRRHQKVIEEAPCPVMTDALRATMGAAACEAARAVGYVGAGTVEFLLAGDGSFYFLEMNTRLQVEHPVTECVTGLDLVAMQLDVAAGLHLGLTQEDVVLTGHAIELRLYAEDPAQGYLPQPGRYGGWSPAQDVRVDHGLQASGEISSAYDPMLAKIIVHGPTRAVARRRALRALEDTVFFGVGTNRGLLARVLRTADFVAGTVHTGWLAGRADLLPNPVLDDRARAVAVAVWCAEKALGDGFRLSHRSPWPLSLSVNGDAVHATVLDGCITVGETRHEVRVLGTGLRRRVVVDGVQASVHVWADGDAVWTRWGDHSVCLAPWRPQHEVQAVGGDGLVCMPMAGKVLSISVVVGDTVSAGDVVARVEAMKLETPLRAAIDGVVQEVLVSPGDAAAAGATVLLIEETP